MVEGKEGWLLGLGILTYKFICGFPSLQHKIVSNGLRLIFILNVFKSHYPDTYRLIAKVGLRFDDERLAQLKDLIE